MGLDGSRFAYLVPLPELLAPQLLFKHLIRSLEALRYLVITYRCHRAVCEAVDI